MLLDAGVPPDAHDAEGSCTPLMLAAHAGARKTLSALLEAGADVSARDASRVTALQAAAAGGREGAAPPPRCGRRRQRHRRRRLLCRLLRRPCRLGGLPAGASRGGWDVHAPNQFGWTPLHAASNFSQCEAVGALLRGAAAAPSPADEVGGRRCTSRQIAWARRAGASVPAACARARAAAVHEAAAATRREARPRRHAGRDGGAHCGGARLRRRLAVAARPRSGRVAARRTGPHAAARRSRHCQAVVCGAAAAAHARAGRVGGAARLVEI